MKAADLRRLATIAAGEMPMTKVALTGLGNAQEIRRQLGAELEKHLRSKGSMADLVDRIKRVGAFQASRAQAIAQTEKTRAVNGSRYANAIDEYLAAYNRAKQGHRKRPQLPMFQWVHTNAAKEPRRNHINISGAVRAVGEEFLPGVLYPGDPNAPPSETIHCHCYIRRYTRGSG